MERADWVNDQVREEIETLKDTHGFEEDEALAFWHLAQAGKLMNEMRSADLREDVDRYEGRDDQGVHQQPIVFDSTADLHSTVLQHFTSLQKVLGHRVLQRAFPNGWGRRYRGLEEG